MRVDKSYPAETSLAIGETFTPCSSTFPVILLACSLLRSGGLRPVWAVLCLIPHNTLHPFGVWNATSRDDGWHLESGDYRSDLLSAVTSYEVRAGNNFHPD